MKKHLASAMVTLSLALSSLWFLVLVQRLMILVLQSKVSVYVNNISKTIEINHDLDERLSVLLFDILGSRIMDVKNIAKAQSLDVSLLKTGFYILIGKSSGNYFSKKILIY